MTKEQKQIAEEVATFINSKTHSRREKYFVKSNEIKSIIKTLPSTKAPGPDGIQNLLLKNLPKKIIVHLTTIINGIFTRD